jgi:16S rRNA (guanine527-N7)-methyltransferase
LSDSRPTPAPVDDAELSDRIGRGAAELGIPLRRGRLEGFVAYLRLVERWNRTYNLTAVRDPGAMVVQHLLDCLTAAAALLGRHPSGVHGRVLDVGSGAGLPGLVLASVLPETSVTCVDSVGKKAAFITQAAAVMGLTNASARHSRVEALADERFDLIVSRALASLTDFVAVSRHVLAPGGEWMAMKAVVAQSELADLAGLSFHVEPLRVPGLEAQRCVVWMRPLPQE